MTKLRLKMVNQMKLRNFSSSTQRAYVSAVSDLAKFYRRSPEHISSEEIQRYLLYLMEERGLSWSTRNQVICGLRFFYIQTQGKKSTNLAIPPRKPETRLPEIFSSQELERLFFYAANPRDRALLMTTYACGLRVSEVVRLKPGHLDGTRKMLRVEQGKGNKDRYTILSDGLLEELRSYWRLYKPKEWLFPGKYLGERPMPIGTAQKVYYLAKKKAGLKKGKGIHTLRHCFATHMLEAGVDLRTIQNLMGHSSILTTMVYLQVTQKRLDCLKSSFDLLDLPRKGQCPHED